MMYNNIQKMKKIKYKKNQINMMNNYKYIKKHNKK